MLYIREKGDHKGGPHLCLTTPDQNRAMLSEWPNKGNNLNSYHLKIFQDFSSLVKSDFDLYDAVQKSLLSTKQFTQTVDWFESNSTQSFSIAILSIHFA